MHGWRRTYGRLVTLQFLTAVEVMRLARCEVCGAELGEVCVFTRGPDSQYDKPLTNLAGRTHNHIARVHAARARANALRFPDRWRSGPADASPRPPR
jgi:hypothetical protein